MAQPKHYYFIEMTYEVFSWPKGVVLEHCSMAEIKKEQLFGQQVQNYDPSAPKLNYSTHVSEIMHQIQLTAIDSVSLEETEPIIDIVQKIYTAYKQMLVQSSTVETHYLVGVSNLSYDEIKQVIQGHNRH